MQSELALSQKGQRGRAGIIYDVLQLTESRPFPYHNLAENPSLTAVSTFRLTVPHHGHRISDAQIGNISQRLKMWDILTMKVCCCLVKVSFN